MYCVNMQSHNMSLWTGPLPRVLSLQINHTAPDCSLSTTPIHDPDEQHSFSERRLVEETS